jgi:hypothetical protein
LSFTRASDATRVASNGLIEKVRTNLSLYSEQFDNAWWGASNVTITANNTTDPLGGSAAEKALCAAGTLSPNIFSTGVTCVSGVEYTASYYAKQGTSKYAKIRFSSTAFASATNSPIFDLNAGTLVSGTGVITSVGNGWYRISATQTAEASAGGIFTIDIPSSTGVWPNGTFAGTEFIYIFGYQFEANVSVSPYIATTTAAVSVGPVSGLPRLDYLGSTCPRLILEPQRSNELQYSEQANNAYWSLFGATISANTTATLDPAGYYGSDKLQEDTSTGGHTYGVSISGGSTTKTLSVFAKAAERNWAALRLYNGSSSFFAYFNLSTGALGSVTAGATSAITSYGNGWYRCSITLALGAGSCEPNIFATTGNGTTSYQGVTGSGIYVYGAQLEAGAYATSYIPTLGASVTRVADDASKTGISSLIGQTEGTLYAEWTATNANISGRILAISNGGFADRIAILEDAGTIRLFISTSSVQQVDLTNLGS